MKYRLAIFDLDGTLLNTLDDLAASINYALAYCSMPQRSTEEVKNMVGNGIRLLIERAVPCGTPENEINRVHSAFTEYYKAHNADLTRPYDGIYEMLNSIRLAGVLTAVVSNKADYGVQALCRKYFDRMFELAVGEKEGVRRKPYPDSVYEVLSFLGIDKTDAVYIGDSDVDIKTAANAGMNCISVGWGFRDREFLTENGADIIVSSPEELAKIILTESQNNQITKLI